VDKLFYILSHTEARKNAQRAIMEAPDGYIVEIKPNNRTLEQNSLLWGMLTDISRQVDWYGNKLTQEEWKDVFSASLKKQKVVPGLDGGFVVCGQSTSNMSKKEFADLIELMNSFAAERGVVWSEQDQEFK
jgi:hypothetical protein